MTDHPGLALMQAEMARQGPDALATLDSGRDVARDIAVSLRRTGSLVLYAMGGSHHVSRIVEPLYREAGIEARALVASEALMAPLPDRSRTALVVSQSGESGEIVDLLRRPAGREDRFGLTLERDSSLARGVRAVMVAEGGTERAFAATRSIVLTLAMHAAILEELGQPQQALRATLTRGIAAHVAAADTALAPCNVFIFAGRHAMQGVAESGALSLMELARVPAIGLEGGQFRHGPFEVLRQGLGIILFRSAGPDATGALHLATTAADAGCAVVMFDASGGTPVAGCTHVALAEGSGVAAAVSMLIALQRLNIAIAHRTLPFGIGTPQRTSKVTV